MELNIRAAQEALANPSEQILETMRGASSEAQEAVASVAPSTSALASIPSASAAAGESQSSSATTAAAGAGARVDGPAEEQEDTSRLQVVDEVNGVAA